MNPKVYYQLVVTTRNGRTYRTAVQATEGTPDMTVGQVREHIDKHVDTSWQPAGMFNLGDHPVECDNCGREHAGPLRINAQQIEAIRLVWYDDCPGVDRT